MSRRSSRHWVRWRLCGFAFAGILLLDAAAVVAAGSWHQRLGKVEDALAGGDWQAARDRSVALRSKMVRKVVQAHELLPLAARTLALQAIAEANLGQNRAAEWHWLAAQGFVTGLPSMDLGGAGRARDLLAGLSVDQLPSGVVPQGVAGSAGRYQPVQIRRSVTPELPKALQRADLVGAVILDVVVDARGRPRRPHVVDPGPVPTMAFPVLEALRHWVFIPARQDGQPVAVLYQLRIDY